jgi:RNA polymerase sigma factor (sigma-70 family)
VSDSGKPQTQPSADWIERLDATWPEIGADCFCSLRAKLKSKQEAHDATQEAYLRIRNHRNPSAILDLKSFAHRVAGNVATDRLRKRSRDLPLDGSFDVEERLQRDFDELRSPEGMCAEQKKREVLARVLEQLPADIKLVCQASLNGEAVKSIADRLGIKTHTVYRDLREAHKLLAEMVMLMPGERDNE